MSNERTELNPGAGGSIIDETGVTVGGETRRRSRIVLAGDSANALVNPTNTAPAAGAYAVPTREVGGTQTDALTDTELRATPVKVDDDATQTLLDTLIAKDYATQATLAALNTAFGDRFPKNAKQFADGKYRTAGGKVALSLAAPEGSFHLANPAGSGRSITITEFTLGTTAAVDVNYLKDATSTGTVQDVFMPNRAYEGAATTVGVLRAGAGVLTGGTVLSPITRLLPAGDRIDYTAVLLPGQSLAVRATAATTLDFYGSCTWVEENL